MDITVQCGALVDQLSQLVGIASRKSTALPILSNVLVDASGTAIAISATDTDISAQVVCPAQVALPGRGLLPAKRLLDIAKLLPSDGSLRLADTPNGVKVECGRYNSRLAAASAADFPAFPTPNGAVSSTLPAGVFADLIRKVSFIRLEGDQRYFLNGANMILSPNGRVSLMATDGHRFALASAPRPAGPDAAALIPHDALGELSSLFADSDSDIAFARESSHLRFSAGQRFLLATQIDGKFPNLDAIMKTVQANDKIATLDRDVLAGAVKRVALTATDNSQSAVFTLSAGLLAISTASADVGDASEQVEAGYDGPVVTARLSAAYLLGFLDAAGPGAVTMKFKDAISAVLCSHVEGAVEYHYVIMPIVL